MKTKFVQVEGRDGYKKTYTTPRVAEDMIHRGTATSFKPVTLKQIKVQGLHQYREDDYFQHIAEDEFMAMYNGKRFKATVHSFGPGWCDALVTIHGADLPMQYIYACNIKGAKTWYPETACVYYDDKQVIEVELKVFHGFQLFVCGLTPGILDEQHWNRIKEEPLAFRCDENGKATTGLFK